MPAITAGRSLHAKAAWVEPTEILVSTPSSPVLHVTVVAACPIAPLALVVEERVAPSSAEEIPRSLDNDARHGG